MPITVIVRSAAGTEARLTFDGMQPVVIGRGASCDVRLPDASVSHRHACLRVQGADFVLLDEGSTNGTFVEGESIAAHTSRIVRSGAVVRVGRIWFELRMDHGPVTRDMGAATRDLALELVSLAMAERGGDRTMRVRVLEGPDQGSCLALSDEGHAYVLGRGEDCDLALSDRDASRQHVHVERRGLVVVVSDLGTKNGTWLGGTRAPDNREVPWRPAQVMRIGRTVLTLEEPVGDALAQIESAPDEPLVEGEPAGPPPAPSSATPTAPTPSAADTAALQHDAGGAAPIAAAPMKPPPAPTRRERTSFSIADFVVIGAAVGVLALSIAGLMWLLRS